MELDRIHFGSLHSQDSAAASCHTNQGRFSIRRTRHLNHMWRHQSQSHIVRLLEEQSSWLRPLVGSRLKRPRICKDR